MSNGNLNLDLLPLAWALNSAANSRQQQAQDQEIINYWMSFGFSAQEARIILAKAKGPGYASFGMGFFWAIVSALLFIVLVISLFPPSLGTVGILIFFVISSVLALCILRDADRYETWENEQNRLTLEARKHGRVYTPAIGAALAINPRLWG